MCIRDRGKIDPKGKFTHDPARTFQLIEIIRKLSPHELAKLKYITNFSVPIETKDKFLENMLLSVSDFEKSFDNINIIDLLVILLYCHSAFLKLTDQSIKTDLKNISPNLLRRFLEKNPDICAKHNINFNETTAELDEKSELKTLIIPSAPVIPTKRSNDPKKTTTATSSKPQTVAAPIGGKPQTPAFDETDKYDFPSLVGKKTIAQPTETKPTQDYPTLIPPAEKIPEKKKNGGSIFTNNSWGSAGNPFLYTAQENELNLKKKLAEEFPSLGPGLGGPAFPSMQTKTASTHSTETNTSKEKEPVHGPSPSVVKNMEDDNSEWGPIKGKKPKGKNNDSDDEEVTVIKKGKKGKKVIYMAGGFQ
eukprot:TRINITY_DN5181_c0_g1_i1.p1 TRINITY_DN5181_c0_g1~~TRINITY_DN5181_c0_g1_i1.p1  ORF type:complete len:363 (-),score=83.61 TRINITY_DN5181_c0_g1_i1:1025-2113(-)